MLLSDKLAARHIAPLMVIFAQAPLAAEGKSSSKQHLIDQLISSPLCSQGQMQTVDFYLTLE